MKPLLLVFHPRQIDECVESLERLPIEKVWLTGYSEREREDVVPEVVHDAKRYTHLLAISDDGVIPPVALQAVLAALEDGHPVATGYSNLDQTDMRVNLTKTPFRNLSFPDMGDYDLYHITEAIAYPKTLIPTFFAGYALTGMSREMWQRYPFKVCGDGGWASDWVLACRLLRDEIPIVAPREAFVWHVKEVINATDQEPRKQSLVGIVEPRVEWGRDLVTA